VWAILKQIESLGYAVSVSRAAGRVTMRARRDDPLMELHVQRCAEGEAEEYRAACALAEMVGIDLEDG
jgi:hypothetical protein